jgi:hypothetical protein
MGPGGHKMQLYPAALQLDSVDLGDLAFPLWVIAPPTTNDGDSRKRYRSISR